MEWFKFPVTKWLLPKYQRLCAEAQRDYILLCCLYWHYEGDLKLSEAQDNVNMDLLMEVIEIDGDEVHIDFLREQLFQANEIKEKRRVAGAKGGQASAKQKVASAKQVLSKTKQTQPDKIREDKRRGEKIREEETREEKREVILPFGEGFESVWSLWKEYKLKEHKFKYKTPQSEMAAIKKIVELSNGNEAQAIQIVEQSLANGWKGFFELKNKQDERNNFGTSALHNFIAGE